MKDNRGITLIALIITIIIMLILAGIGINLIIGENSIIKKAIMSKELYIKATLKEELELKIAEIEMEKVSRGEGIQRQDLYELNEIGANIESVGIPAIGEYKDYEIEIDENYVVTIKDKKEGQTPEGEATLITQGIVPEGGKVQIRVTASIQNGEITNIEPTNGANLVSNVSNTEKIYEVDKNGMYYFKITANNGRTKVIKVEVNIITEKTKINIKDVSMGSFIIEVENNYKEDMVLEYKYYINGEQKFSGIDKQYIAQGLEEETEYEVYVETYIKNQAQPIVSDSKKVMTKDYEIAWTNDTNSNRTIDNRASSYKNPKIPVGFHAINTAVSEWNLENGEQNTWNEGLVIKDIENGNEFVWIPVDGTDVEYKAWCTHSISYTLCTDLESPNIINTVENVTSNQGFWVARYEAGLPETINQEIADVATRNVEGKPISIAGAVPWNCIDHIQSLTNAEIMYSNQYVQSGLINGRQWDTIMKWLNNSNYNVLSDSSGIGNFATGYRNLRKQYAYHSTDGGATWVESPVTRRTLMKTGASNETRTKNIYDIAGNLYEWTSERYNGQGIARSACYITDARVGPAAYRYNSGANTSTTLFYTSFRPVLYVK
ncbi:MAG: hypothetical protein HFJ53_07880 [Clostridia bacterium]|nr:hypothetical protein [Clostridia bacterium]